MQNRYNRALEYYLLEAQKDTITGHKVTIQVKWIPLIAGSIKLNIDGVVKESLGVGDTGGVFRDHNNSWMGGFSHRVAWTTPVMAEIQALLKVL